MPPFAGGASQVTQGTASLVGLSGLRPGMKPRDPDAIFLSTLLAVDAIATQENAESIRRRLVDLRQRVERDRFQLAAAGRFKRGKTSVLNALLHSEVLPVGVIPFPRLDAASFVTSPGPPLTLAETEFLKKLARATKRIFLVMDKVDLLDARSLAAVLELTRNAISTILGDYVPLYPVSARQVTEVSRRTHVGLDSPGMHRLESDLRNFLKKERNDVFYRSILRSVLNFIGDLGIQQNEVTLFASVSRLVGLVESETTRFAESSALLDSTVRAYLKHGARTSKRDLASPLDRFTALEIEHTFDQWLPDFESSLGYALPDASAKFLQATNEVLESPRNAAVALFGTELSSLQIVEELPVIHGNSDTNLVTGSQGEPPPFLLPWPIFRWGLLHDARKAVPLELERTRWLVASDLQSCLSGLSKTFMDQVRNRLREIVEAVRLVLAHGVDGERLALLSAHIGKLDQITQTLRAGLGAEYALEA